MNAEDQEDFLREAQTVVRLAHPHIVRILDFGVDDQTPYLAMDYAPGGTLRQRHRRGERLGFSTVAAYVQQVAEALQYIHNQRLIHRDVKPENMLVGKDNELLLGDFGIALVAQSSRYQSTQDVVGTVAYMAPEQIQGQSRPASDQYALAIVVYEWLCGERPFNGSFTELYTQHLFAPVPSLRAKVSSIAPEVEEVIMTALAKDPKERFASIGAFATALEQTGKIRPAVSVSLLPAAPLAPGTPVPTSNPVRGAISATTAPTLNPSPDQQSSAPTQQATLPGKGASGIPIPSSHTTPPLPPAIAGLAASGITRRSLLTAGGIGLGAIALGGALLTLQASHIGNLFVTPTPPLPKNLLFRYQGHTTTNVSGVTVSLLWSPDSTRILSTDGKTVQVWDAFDGKHTSTYHLLDSSSSRGEGFDMAWTPNGPCLAQADSNTRLIHGINATTGQDIAIYSGHASDSEYLSRQIISWSPDCFYWSTINYPNHACLGRHERPEYFLLYSFITWPNQAEKRHRLVSR